MGLTIHRTAERPDLQLWLRDDDDSLVDLSSGYTFTFKLGDPGQAASFTKSSGITGAAGSGTEPSGTPNITIAFTAAEIDDLTVGVTLGQVTATTSGLSRVWQFGVTVADVIT